MYFKPPQNNMTNPFYHPLNKQPVQEAVTVELDFKSDAEGKKAGGKMVRKGVYKMTFKNNAEMNKFMDTHADKLNEGTAEYRAMMKKYKGSDMEKVFKILDKEGFRMGEQSDTLVRNMLKKHRGNVKKAADQIMKDNPGMFDVNRMMMDHVEIDEEKKLDSRGLGVTRQSGLGSKKVNGEKAREVLTSAKVPHSMVMGTIRVPERFVKIAKKKLDDAFGGMFQKKTGFKISGTMKEDVEQVDEAEVYKRPVKVSALGGQKFHAIVQDGKIVAAGMTEKEARKMKKFGQQVRELPGAKVGQLVKEDVEQVDEMSAKQHYNKMVAQGKVGRGGRLVTPIDRKRFPNREKEGLEGPFRSRKSGQVYYYDKKAGKYYDPLSDMFLQVKDVMENTATYNLDEYLAEEND